MKIFTLIVSALSFATATRALEQTPTVESEADVSKRDLESIASSLLKGFDVADIVSKINYEKIAGWADDLLNEGHNIDYLDNILVHLKNTELLPKAALYLITNNSTKEVTSKVLLKSLSVVDEVNTTSFFVALDRSGLAYSLIADTLEDDEFLPSILNVSRKLIATGDLSFENILKKAGKVLSQRSEIFVDSDVSEYDIVDLEKRDNVEDLLTTVFESIERSGLLNDTVHTLVTSEEFQDSAVVLLQGLLQNLGSNSTSTSSTNFTSLKPVLASLKESGLLQHTLSRALKDQKLRKSLERDLASLLKQGKIKETDLVSKQVAQSYSEKLATNSGSATASSTSVASKTASTTASTTKSKSSGSSHSSSSSKTSSSSAPKSTSSSSGSSSIFVSSGLFSFILTALTLQVV